MALRALLLDFAAVSYRYLFGYHPVDLAKAAPHRSYTPTHIVELLAARRPDRYLSIKDVFA